MKRSINSLGLKVMTNFLRKILFEMTLMKLSPSALGSGRLRLRPKHVLPDVQAQVPASHMPTQAQLHSQTEAYKPSNDQPSHQSSTLKEQEELFFDSFRQISKSSFKIKVITVL